MPVATIRVEAVIVLMRHGRQHGHVKDGLDLGRIAEGRIEVFQRENCTSAHREREN